MPEFDPNQPFEVEEQAAPATFDPNLPFEVESKEKRLNLPEQKQSTLSKTLNNVKMGTRSALKGGTFGFADEIGSGIAAGVAKGAQEVGLLPGEKSYGEIYSDIHGSVGEEDRQWEEENPVLSTGLEIAGSMPTALGGAATAGKLGLKAATSMKGLAARGAAGGGAYGGLYGAGTADEGERLAGAGEGALLGTIMGGTVPVAISGAGKGIQSAYGSVKNLMAGKGEQANRFIAQLAKRAGMSPDDVAKKLNDLGSEGTLSDVDESFLYTARDMLNKLGPVKQQARDMVDARQLKQHGDILKSFSDELGDIGTDNLDDALATLKTKRSEQAGPLYKAAFDADFAEDLSKNKVLRLDNIQEALRAGEKIAKNDPNRIASSGALKPVERLHYAKKALWDQAQELKQKGQREFAGTIDKQRKAVDEILNTVPEYKQARKIWSSSMENEAAVDVGNKILSNKVRPREFARELAGMNDADKSMARLAAFEEVSNKIGGTADTRAVSKLLTNNVNIRDKVRALFGSDEAFKKFAKKADKWDTFNRTRQTLIGGSPTTQQQKASVGVEEIAQAAIAPKLAVVNWAKNKLTGGLSPDVVEEVGNKLIKQGMAPQEVMSILTEHGVPKMMQTNAMAPALAITQNRMSR